jgi:hypothetical protein
MLQKTTEIEAVNTLLSTIGESPISSLDEAASGADAAIALSVLREVSRKVQMIGWHFNQEKNFRMTPSTSGEIFLPANCAQIDASGDQGIDVAERGGRLYNRTDQTYIFKQTVKVDMTLLLEFEELPLAARTYIVDKSARIFQNRTVGSQLLTAFTAEDEKEAKQVLKKYESQTADYNILTDNVAVSRVLRR